MTRLSQSLGQANGPCTRIQVTDDCISLDVDDPGARCTPCKNKIEDMLGTRKKKMKNNDGTLYQSRHFVCWKPWVLKRNMDSNQYHAHELVWAKLEQQGYPCCLDTAVVLKMVEVEVAKNDGENNVATIFDGREECNNQPKPQAAVMPSNTIRPN
jgi:hypothetical protein